MVEPCLPALVLVVGHERGVPLARLDHLGRPAGRALRRPACLFDGRDQHAVAEVEVDRLARLCGARQRDAQDGLVLPARQLGEHVLADRHLQRIEQECALVVVQRHAEHDLLPHTARVVGQVDGLVHAHPALAVKQLDLKGHAGQRLDRRRRGHWRGRERRGGVRRRVPDRRRLGDLSAGRGGGHSGSGGRCLVEHSRLPGAANNGCGKNKQQQGDCGASVHRAGDLTRSLRTWQGV